MPKGESKNLTTYINVFDDYVIAVDNLNYSAAKRVGVDKHGRDIYKYYSHHHKLEDALLAVKKEYQRKIIMDHNVFSLDEAVSDIIKANKRFEKLVESCFEGVTV